MPKKDTDKKSEKATVTKQQLLDKALELVAFGGWKDSALEEAAQELGQSPQYGYVYFPGGINDVAETYVAQVDERMNEQLAAKNLNTLKIRERIATAVLTRLELYNEHKEAVRQMVAHYALPHNAPQGLKNVYRTVDAIWYAAGDNATDFNYYTKRMTLMGVYTATVLYWARDESENMQDTKAFLNRRIEDVMKIETVKGKVKEGIKQVETLFRMPGAHGRK